MTTISDQILKDSWLREADKYMQFEYGLAVDHGCFTEDEFYTRFGEDGQKSPREAVDDFAEKYDLFSLKSAWGACF